MNSSVHGVENIPDILTPHVCEILSNSAVV